MKRQKTAARGGGPSAVFSFSFHLCETSNRIFIILLLEPVCFKIYPFLHKIKPKIDCKDRLSGEHIGIRSKYGYM